MSVSIKIVNKSINEASPEYLAACTLRDMLGKSFPDNVKGEINIAYGLTLSGEEVRDVDLFVFGKLENYVLKNYYTNDPQYKKKDLVVDDFCVAVELKEHPIERVDYNSTHILVEYQGYWKDATEQNEKQRYSCASFLRKAIGKEVYCANFVWLKTVTKQQLSQKTNYAKVGALSSSFDFKEMVSILVAQGLVPQYNHLDDSYHISANRYEEIIDDVKQALFSNRPNLTGLTRQRLETITQKRVEGTLNDVPLGDNLVVFKGKAGTGKTFRLIQSALQLANEDTGKRCLLLTYNHALVSDIRRLLHFMEIPDGIDNYTIQIQTLHSFFFQLMRLFDIKTPKLSNAFEYHYNIAITELNDIVKELLDDEEISILKDNHKLAIDWDYILIDEAQDWSAAEKEILYKIYGPAHIVVADGVDQFMRTNTRMHWTAEEMKTEKLSRGMRQRVNLVNFVNILSAELGLRWKLTPNNDEAWCGGQVYIRKHYTKELHNIVKARSEAAGCDNYDMLYLIPHQMKPSNDENCSTEIRRIDPDKWSEKVGVKFFDGTEYSQRVSYSNDVSECRLYQYESCRGLEGWVVVCLNLDILIKNKFQEFENMDFSDSLGLCAPEQALRDYVYQWCLMPLTRPIDTLVITLSDFDTEIGKVLKGIASRCNDYVDLNENA